MLSHGGESGRASYHRFALKTCSCNEPPLGYCYAGLAEESRSDQVHILRLQALWSTFYDERHPRTLFQCAVAAGLNSRKVDEHVFSVLALYKTKSFCRVKPLHSTVFFHIASFLVFQGEHIG